MQREVELKGNCFQQANSLIFRGRPSHQIVNLLSPEKNIEVKIIVVSKQGVFKTKKGEIVQFLVADESACCLMNFFNEAGQEIQEGDVLYVSGAYTSLYKDNLLIYQGSGSIVRRTGRWYLKFSLANNISQPRGTHA
jgi:ssDNA-binding replication factor A large subunit